MAAKMLIPMPTSEEKVRERVMGLQAGGAVRFHRWGVDSGNGAARGGARHVGAAERKVGRPPKFTEKLRLQSKNRLDGCVLRDAKLYF